jgi:hypothetical protein
MHESRSLLGKVSPHFRGVGANLQAAKLSTIPEQIAERV